MVTQPFRSCVFAALLLVAAVGCRGDRVDAVTATGQVTVDGKPLSGATITFEPIDSTAGPSATVPIFAGRFDLASQAELRTGKFRVRIAMIPAEILASFPPEQQTLLPPKDAVISPAFDANSTLTCTLQSDQPNKLHFEVGFL